MDKAECSLHIQSPPRPASPGLTHSVIFTIPLPSATHAERLAKILAVDPPLRQADVHLTYAQPIEPSETLQITLRARTVRQLRLACNSLLDDTALVVDSMAAFEPGAVEEKSGDKMELGSIGRAG